MKNNFRKVLALAVTTSAVAVAAIPVGAHGAPLPPRPAPASSDPLTPLELAQINSPAYVLAHKISDLAGYTDNDDSAGYARVRYNVSSNGVDLWWKGKLDDSVQSLLDSAKASGVTVTVHPAVHTRTFMTKRSGLLINNPTLVGEGIDARSVTMPDDMSGFDVAVSRSGQDFIQTSAKTKQFGAAATGIPIHSVSESSSAPDVAAASRTDDTAPWYAGGQLISTPFTQAGQQVRHYCTTGFAVNDHGTDALLSAAHCDDNISSPNLGWYNGTITAAGTIAHHTDTKTKPTLDSMLLDVVGGSAGYMYGGGYTNSYAAGVAGSQGNNIGDVVRTSGANSGQHNDIVINQVDYTRSCEFNSEFATAYTCYYGAIATKGTPGNVNDIAVAVGDSGGPVYTRVSATDTRVYARGIISAVRASGEIPNCDTAYAGNLAYAAPNTCSTGLVYQEINPILNTWGITLKRVS